jgi:hypothetical protein
MGEREVDRHPAAHRVPDQRGTIDAGRIHDGGQILDVRVRPAGFGAAGAAVAAEVVAQDPVRVREHAELLVPDP